MLGYLLGNIYKSAICNKTHFYLITHLTSLHHHNPTCTYPMTLNNPNIDLLLAKLGSYARVYARVFK